MAQNMRRRLRGKPVNAPPTPQEKRAARSKRTPRLPGTFTVVARNLGEHRMRLLVLDGRTPQALLPRDGDETDIRRRSRILDELANEAAEHRHLLNLRAIRAVALDLPKQVPADNDRARRWIREQAQYIDDLRIEAAARLRRDETTPLLYTPTTGVLVDIPEDDYEIAGEVEEVPFLPPEAESTPSQDTLAQLLHTRLSDPLSVAIIARAMRTLESAGHDQYSSPAQLAQVLVDGAAVNFPSLGVDAAQRERIQWFLETFILARRIVRGY